MCVCVCVCVYLCSCVQGVTKIFGEKARVNYSHQKQTKHFLYKCVFRNERFFLSLKVFIQK